MRTFSTPGIPSLQHRIIDGLVEKWDPLLKRTPSIKGIDKDEQDGLMAQMLENQSNYIKHGN